MKNMFYLCFVNVLWGASGLKLIKTSDLRPLGRDRHGTGVNNYFFLIIVCASGLKSLVLSDLTPLDPSAKHAEYSFLYVLLMFFMGQAVSRRLKQMT